MGIPAVELRRAFNGDIKITLRDSIASKGLVSRGILLIFGGVPFWGLKLSFLKLSCNSPLNGKSLKNKDSFLTFS